MRKAALNEAQSLHKASAISEAEVLKAEADLAEAQIRAELRKEELAKSPANAAAGRLAQQARELRLDLLQDEVRVKVLADRLSALKKARDLLDRYNEITEVELPAVNRQLQELQMRIIQERTDAP